MSSIRVWLRSRGLVDQCFAFRYSMRTVTYCSGHIKAEQRGEYLDSSNATMVLYRRSQETVRRINREASCRLDMTSVRYEYPTKLSIPSLSEQTVNELFSDRKGYDLGLFGVVDEEMIHMVFNITLYGEGTKHGSNEVSSNPLFFHLRQSILGVPNCCI